MKQLELWPEIATRIRVGMIARSIFWGGWYDHVGQIVEIVHDGDEDGPIGVLFAGDQRAALSREREGYLVRFNPEDIQILPDWPIVSRADQLFGSNGYFRCLVPPRGFVRDPLCQMRGCQEPRMDDWAIVNVCGTVVPVSCCYQHHAKAHGMCIEILDLKT